MLYELAEACEKAADDSEVRVVTVAAQGEDFCLGWDYDEVDASARLHLAKQADGFRFLAQITKPTIAIIQGDAVSAGLELALACDIRIAGSAARFGLPEVSRGLLPAAGGTQRLPRLIGRAKALEMVLTSETIDADEAYRYGLVNRVALEEQLLAEAESLARQIAERGPIALQYAKEAAARGRDIPLDQALRLETELTIILQTTEDRAEGMRAFLEKRKPRFRGR
jgi:enoyl-CoA hydratase